MTKNTSHVSDDEYIPTYNVLTIGSSAIDVVASVGGLLTDLALSGWHVDVLLGADDEREDHRIRTLGARTRDLEAGLEALAGGRHPRVIAVGVDAFRTDEGVKRAVRNVLRRRANNVIFWGAVPTANLFGRTVGAQYLPSAAAQAFKAIALTGAPAHAGAEQVYLSGTSRRLPVDLDLVSAS